MLAHTDCSLAFLLAYTVHIHRHNKQILLDFCTASASTFNFDDAIPLIKKHMFNIYSFG